MKMFQNARKVAKILNITDVWKMLLPKYEEKKHTHLYTHQDTCSSLFINVSFFLGNDFRGSIVARHSKFCMFSNESL